jgi:hypothetical protein
MLIQSINRTLAGWANYFRHGVSKAAFSATTPRQAQTTAERWRQVHDLLERGTGLLECSRPLGLSLPSG